MRETLVCHLSRLSESCPRQSTLVQCQVRLCLHGHGHQTARLCRVGYKGTDHLPGGAHVECTAIRLYWYGTRQGEAAAAREAPFPHITMHGTVVEFLISCGVANGQ